jgi:flagellar biosynthesis/type III secretory pathway protein FliH
MGYSYNSYEEGYERGMSRGFEEGHASGCRIMKEEVLEEIRAVAQTFRTAENEGNGAATSVRVVLGQLAQKIEAM